ncbi:HNH endonuclease signature motif containing protein [Thalassotalea psychrophila]|uniref:HNH endonuclease signature motif containing protein n=1 Tax=Thalassotalea psychrophila TaxID=3065647 RepID=A0ABY9TRK7_9GAMM|nr:HNH endonuclease signature motif containing protein [Colwelliaceae bacterium SQ149]
MSQNLIRTYAGVENLRGTVRLRDKALLLIPSDKEIKAYKGVNGLLCCVIKERKYRWLDVVYALILGPLSKQQMAVCGNYEIYDWIKHLHTRRIREVADYRIDKVKPTPPLLSAEIRNRFEYFDGKLYSIKVKNGSVKRTRTGRQKDSYWYIQIKGIEYPEHQLVWIYFNGEIPLGLYVDHIFGNGLNNKITNLQVITPSANNIKRPLQTNNSSGCAGVSSNKKGSYTARFCDKHLGSFRNENDAITAYNKARKEHDDFLDFPSIYEPKGK